MTTKRNIKVKSTAKKANVKKVYAHFQKGSAPYANVSGPTRSLLICAAFVASGFASMTKTTIGVKKGGSKTAFVGLVGSSPWNHHRRAGRIGEDGLTSEGLEWFRARIRDEAGHDLTAQLAGAMTKGGKVGELNFNREIAG